MKRTSGLEHAPLDRPRSPIRGALYVPGAHPRITTSAQAVHRPLPSR